MAAANDALQLQIEYYEVAIWNYLKWSIYKDEIPRKWFIFQAETLIE